MESKQEIREIEANQNIKHKPPSKIERNRKRLEKFLNKDKGATKVDKEAQINENDIGKVNQIDPTGIYNNIETNLNFLRIEEPKNLTRCPRHVVRHVHKNGHSIRFPCPEAEDRIHIKIAGLPTTPIIL